MIVKRAAVLGQCMGVKRAAELALATARAEKAAGARAEKAAGARAEKAAGARAEKASGGRVYTLGPLIHNPQAVAELEAAGVTAISEAELDGRVRDAAVVLRAHGVPPALKARLEALGARIVDATCPRVLASQRKAADFAKRGWKVVIAGDEGHGEVAGIAGHAPGASIVGSPEEAERVEAGGRPVALIAQTTIRKEEYSAIREVLKRRFPALEVVESICPCTEDRLRAVADLARGVEAVVIVGGRNSANTARLLAAAREILGAAWLVETADELPDEVFGFASVGLSAGASTPERLVDEVEARLLRGR